MTRFLIFLFFLLALVSSFTPYFQVDLHISRTIQSIQLPLFAEIMQFISLVGNNPFIEVIIGLTFLFLFRSGLKKEALLSLFASGGSALIGSIVKLVVRRPRPEISLVNVWVSLKDKSFPSNHALIYTAFFGFLFYLSLYVFKNKLTRSLVGTVSGVLILGVGLSRIYLGAHWASDVLGGHLLGAIFLIFTIRIYNNAN